MKTILRILAAVAFMGAVYWAFAAPREPEPYVTAIGLLAGLLGSFYSGEKIPPPDIIAYIINIGRNQHRLVLKNRSSDSARNVRFKLNLKPNQEDPIVIGSGLDSDPIPEIFGHDEKQFLIALTLGSGAAFDAEWSWEDSKKKKYSRKDRIGIKN